ncbi:MAG: hypothetical protein ACRDHI_12075 [Actinomycetota bacterium]
MAEAVERADPGVVDEWVRGAAVAALLPPRRQGGAALSGHVEPTDRLAVAAGVWLSVAALGGAFVVVPVADPDAPRRAVAGDGAFAGLLSTMLEDRASGSFRGEAYLPPGHPDGGAGPPPLLDGGDERAIDVDQSNDSVIVGGSAVVKLFPLAAPGPQPGLDLPIHLASVGFPSHPAPLGALRWRSPGGDEVVLATASAYLPGARDGWVWYLERALRWLDGTIDDPAAFDPAPAMGRIAARMHAALGTPSPVIPDPVREADVATADAWRRSALGVAAQASALTPGDEGARLIVRTGPIRAALDELGDAVGTVTTRVHGDFHVGQVLEWERGYAVTDFDGDPMTPPAERAGFDTPVRDVAAFMRSIDHVGRVASTRRLGRDVDVDAWIATSRAGFLDAYRHELEGLGAGASLDERLLRPLEVAQACHEFVYAARFLPRWLPVADRAMQALIPAEA